LLEGRRGLDCEWGSGEARPSGSAPWSAGQAHRSLTHALHDV
jgi:hypothetical protein